jgi:hypothetical protein
LLIGHCKESRLGKGFRLRNFVDRSKNEAIKGRVV